MSFLIHVPLQNYFDMSSGVQNSHIKGLLSLIQLRGGLHTLSANEPLKRVVTWADLVHAASNDRTPCLGISVCNAGYNLKGVFPDWASANCSAGTIYPKQPPVPGLLKEVFQTIRLLYIAQSSPEMADLNNTFNRRIVANVLYRIEYLLLDPLLLPLEVSESHEQSNQSDYYDFRTPLFSATTAGALIFTYSCLRNLATPSRPYERLVRRLRLNLQLVFDEEKSMRAGSEQDDSSIGKPRNSSSPVNANPSLLLWLLMHGFKATARGCRGDDRKWFVKRGAEMCKDLEIHSVEELDMRIREVVASRTQCAPSVKAFWRAICEHELEETIQDASE
jgi:hypothetical protein